MRKIELSAVTKCYQTFISTVKLASDSDAALAKRTAGRGSLICVWLFLSDDSGCQKSIYHMTLLLFSGEPRAVKIV